MVLRLSDKKPNFLSPTLRERHRYIAYEIICEQNIEYTDLSNAIWHSIMGLLGEKGCADAGVWIMRSAWDEKKRIGFIRCSHLAVEHVRAALALVNKINENPVIVRVLGVSGTIKAAKKKFLGETDLMSYA